MECLVIVLLQFNCSLEQWFNKWFIMLDLWEFGVIEQDVDIIMFIYCDEVYNEDFDDKGMAEIIIGKQWNGFIGIVCLVFLGCYICFEDLVYNNYGEYQSLG